MGSKSPRILYLTSNCPHAPSYGSQLRALNIARLLQECGQLQMVLLERADPFSAEALEKTKAEFNLKMVMKLSPTRIRGIRERFRHELNPSVLNTHGSWPSSRQSEELEKLVAEHDVVWLHNIFVANHAGLKRWPRSVLDIDDVLTQYYRSALKAVKDWKERARALRHLLLWKRRESVLLERFNILSVCSEADRRYLGNEGRIHTIPNGYGMNPMVPNRSLVDPPRLGFIGTLEYAPNREGIEWFILQVWPLIKQNCPSVRLRLVGAGTDDVELGKLSPDIDGLGRIEDAAEEIATWTLGIVPIRIGGGTRIKIAEGFSRKCPLVSTSWGAFGYEVSSGVELLLADTPQAFADACVQIIQDGQFGESLAERAWEKYKDNWTWSAIKPRVEAAVEHCLTVSATDEVAGVNSLVE